MMRGRNSADILGGKKTRCIYGAIRNLSSCTSFSNFIVELNLNFLRDMS